MFNRLFVAMIESGESSGTLDTVLDRLAIQIEKETRIKRRVKSAMVYPLVVLDLRELVLIFMPMFIVPVFVKVFDQLNGDLPKPTQMIVNLSNILRALVVGDLPDRRRNDLDVPADQATEPGRRKWDLFKLRVPMQIGEVVRKIALARMSRTLSSLVSGSVDIVKALEISAARPATG